MSLIDFLPYLAPAVVIVSGARAVAGWLLKEFKAEAKTHALAVKDELAVYQKAAQAEAKTTKEALDRIEAQTTRTNGRVDKLASASDVHQGMLLVLAGEERMKGLATL